MADSLLQFLKNSRWGAKKAEVQRWLREWAPMPPHPTQNAIGFIGSLYEVPVGVVCYFRGGLLGSKLAKTNINFWDERPDDEVIETLYERLRGDLEEDLGPVSGSFDQGPSNPIEFRHSEMVYWLLPDSVLVLSCALLRHGVSLTASPIGIAYSDRRFDPIAQSLA